MGDCHHTDKAPLFQAGYLTIREARQLPSGTWRYTLACPNREVAVSLSSRMFARYGDGFRKIGLGVGGCGEYGGV